MTKEEFDELVTRYRSTSGDERDEAMGAILDGLRPMIVSIVNRHMVINGLGDQWFDDLMQEGVIGLLLAIEKFDENRGVKLSTFAYHWIRSYVGKYIQNNRNAIRMPRYLQQEGTQLIRTADKVEMEVGVRPPLSTTAEIAGVTERRAEMFSGAAVCIGSIDDADVEIGQFDEFDEYLRLVGVIVDILDDRTREILVMRFVHEQSVRSIAAHFDMTSAWVHLIIRDAKKLLSCHPLMRDWQ